MATQPKSNVRALVGKPSLAEVPHYLRNISFETHVLARSPVLARDGTVLRLNAQMGETALQRVVGSWNVVLRGSYPGCGYFAEHPQQQGGDERVYVLFADDVFYKAFLTGDGAKDVEAVEASIPSFTSHIRCGSVVEEIVMTELPATV